MDNVEDTSKPISKMSEIDALQKVASGNNHNLSSIADNKAQMLITVNSIILSAIIGLNLKQLHENQYLMLPSFISLAISLVTITLAILATRPSIPTGKFSEKDIADKKVNLLFFGNFYNMQLEDYSKGMRTVLNDPEFLYDSLIKDLFIQGKVLGRKYLLLRAAYTVFMYGIILAIIVFVITSIYHSMAISPNELRKK